MNTGIGLTLLFTGLLLATPACAAASPANSVSELRTEQVVVGKPYGVVAALWADADGAWVGNL